MKYQILADKTMRDMARTTHEILQDKGVDIEYNEMNYTRFSSDEDLPVVNGNVRNRHVFYFHDMAQPTPNEAWGRLLLSLDSISRSAVDKISLVAPYLSYMRQDRKSEPHEPISAKVLAKSTTIFPKLDQLIAYELHTPQIQGFWDINVEEIPGRIVYAGAENVLGSLEDVMYCATDSGGVKRTRDVSQMVLGHTNIGMFGKFREDKETKEITGYSGPKMSNKTVVLYDDLSDTGGTTVDLVGECYKQGAKSVIAEFPHAVLSTKNGQSAEDKFRKENVKAISTDSIPRGSQYERENADWLTILPIAPSAARVIEEIVTDGSVTGLYRLGADE